jgi:hypothetical protein
VSSEVLGAMITPAVLMSASGLLVLSTSNRVGRTVWIVYEPSRQRLKRLQISSESASPSGPRRKHIAEQLSQRSERAVLLRAAMTALYTAIGLLVATSIFVGIVALLDWRYSELPLVLGFAGACALLYGSLLLVREARLAYVRPCKQCRLPGKPFSEARGRQKIKSLVGSDQAPCSGGRLQLATSASCT